MKKIYNLLMLSTMLLLVTGFTSAVAPKCGGLDICIWTTSGNPDNGLPLGSGPYSGCPLLGNDDNTYWPIGSEALPSLATATCVFDGNSLSDVMLYLSIDNDIITCTLNDFEVFSATTHEDCAPADPMNGYSQDISSALNSGQNTLVCEVRDRGVMSHFDACVVGEVNTQCNTEETVLGGTVYQDIIANPVGGASVEAVCHHGGTDYLLTSTTLSNGKYSVVFPSNQCDFGDLVTVNAQKDALTGTNDGSITMTYGLPCEITLNVGIVNVPLVPEFGVIVSVLTVLGALSVFFVVRKK
jgi:hypothetical protein